MNGAANGAARGPAWPRVFIGLTALLGAALTWGLWRAQTARERRAAYGEFRAEAEALRGAVAAQVRNFFDVMDSLRQLHSLSDRISQADFEEFVRKGLIYQQQVLGGFGFVQRIPRELRAVVEAGPGGTPAAFAITEPDGAGGVRPAGAREEYFPLTYQTPAGVLGVPAGFDFGARPEDRAAVERMRRGGGFAAGAAMPGGGRLIFAPILYPTVGGEPVAPPGWLVGFVAAVFRPADLLARALPGARRRGLRAELLEPGTAAADLGTGPAVEAPLDVGGAAWRLRCTAEPRYLGAYRSRRAELILVLGSALTLLLTGQLALMARQTRRVENLVRRRTQDLHQAHARLETEMAERIKLEREVLEISDREKQRVGHDLHDSLGQKLTGAAFLSRALAQGLRETAPERQSAAQLSDILKDSVAQVRRIARGLAPVEVGQDGLKEALERLAGETRAAYGVECELVARGQPRLPGGEAPVHLYRIAQEAVTNAARHGQARRIVIRLLAEDGGGRLRVEDDGVGLPDQVEAGGGLGLRLMRYRAGLMGGAWAARRRPEGGTLVECAWRAQG